MNHIPTVPSTVVDPVCGMTIEPATAAGSSHYGSRTYYFCSRGCEAKFESEPADYVESGAVSRASAASCCSASSGSSCCRG